MYPYINCKTQALWYGLNKFNKSYDILLNNTIPVLFFERDLLRIKAVGYEKFEELFEKNGIKYEKYEKVHDIVNFISQNLIEGKAMILKVDLYYEPFSLKYYQKIHRTHNLYIENYDNINHTVSVMEQEYSGSESYLNMIFTLDKVKELYDGYIEYFYDSNLDVEDTVVVLSENDSKLDYVPAIRDEYIGNIQAIFKWIDDFDKYSLEQNLENIGVLERFKKLQDYLTIRENVKTIIDEEQKILRKMKRLLVKEDKEAINQALLIIKKYELQIVKDFYKKIICFYRYNDLYNIEELDIEEPNNITFLKDNVVTQNIEKSEVSKRNNFKSFDSFDFEDILKKLEVDINHSEEDVTLKDKEKIVEFVSKIGEIKHINYQNNSVNGAITINGKRHFFKLLSKIDAQNEIKGFFLIFGNISVANIEKVIVLKNVVFLMHEYDYSVRNNDGLLNDLFVKCEKNETTFEKVKDKVDKIINEYIRPWKNTKYEVNYPMQKFYNERVEGRLISWYKDSSWLDEEVTVNGKYTLKPRIIYDEIIEFFNKQEETLCILSQGDPNCMNIGIKPIFFDYATSGYNAVEAEIAAMIWSIIFADLYLCPKYHRNSYNLHEDIYDYLNNYRPEINIDISHGTKNVNIQAFTSKIRKYFVQKTLENANLKLDKNIKYYLFMRLLCIFNINTMDEEDRQYIISLLIKLYYDIDSNFELEKLLNNFKER